MAWSAEKSVGIFVVGGLILLGVMTILVEDFRFYSDSYELIAYFPTVEGLQKSDPVTLGGVEVGKVSDMRVVDRRIEVHLELDNGTVVRDDSVASIKMISLFGGMNVAITIGSEDNRILAAGETLTTGEGNGVDALMAKLGNVMDDTSLLVASLNENQDKVLNKIHTILADNEVALGEAIGAFQDAAEAIGEAGPKLNELLDSAAVIAKRVEEGDGTLGKLINSDEVYNSVIELTDSVKEVAKAAERIVDENGSDIRAAVASLKEAGEKVSTTLDTVSSITAKIDRGEGTLGKVINDPGLYDDARKTIDTINEAAEGVREQTPITGFLGVLFNAFGG
jgi:phospholipid/cholesterol/gamma-HCH transport system substrate-binding protein